MKSKSIVGGIKSTLGKLNLNYLGLALGAISYGLSLTPSLLPRPTLYQGLLSGIAFAVGYGIGVIISWAFRKIDLKEPDEATKHGAWLTLGVLGPVIVVVFSLLSVGWQNEVQKLVGEEPDASGSILTIFLLALIVAVIIIGVARLIGILNKLIAKQLHRFLPKRTGIVVGWLATALLVVWFYNGFLLNSLEKIADNTYSTKNAQTPDGITQPIKATRSGSDESLVPWGTVGYQGKEFVSRGPSQQDMLDFSGQAPKEQIRVYAGIDSAPSARERAKLVLEELIRTDAFSREILLVATATGTGWLEPQSTESLEYMYNGDTAIASIQYSYLPSWMATLVDKDSASEAGIELLDTIHDYWAKLPSDNRPKLIAYGLSLGSYGSQAAFSGSQDLESRTDGALFMGTPSFTEPWGYFTDNRDEGSLERLPVYDASEVIGFAATHTDIADLAASDDWGAKRVLYMQHGSDPVVWWNPDLLLHKPDWLKEPAAYDVTTKFLWYPVLTFLQVSVDQFVGVSPPNGHGHNYGDTIVAAWAAVTQPEGWTIDDSSRLQSHIDGYANE